MPTPQPNESKKDYMKRCQKHVIDKEGEKPDRAYKKCEGMWNQHQKKKKSESVPLFDFNRQFDFYA